MSDELTPSCIDCAYHAVIDDQAPYLFNDDVAVVCSLTRNPKYKTPEECKKHGKIIFKYPSDNYKYRVIAAACTINKLRNVALIPPWCPEKQAFSSEGKARKNRGTKGAKKIAAKDSAIKRTYVEAYIDNLVKNISLTHAPQSFWDALLPLTAAKIAACSEEAKRLQEVQNDTERLDFLQRIFVTDNERFDKCILRKTGTNGYLLHESRRQEATDNVREQIDHMMKLHLAKTQRIDDDLAEFFNEIDT